MTKSNKLNMNHIAPYLPYGVDMIFEKSGSVRKLTGLSCQNDNKTLNFIFGAMSLDQELFNYKPILHPLSDLTKDCWLKKDKCFVTPEACLHIGRQIPQELTIQIANSSINFYHCPNWLREQLLEWHFDVFNLIGQGLAFDINNLN